MGCSAIGCTVRIGVPLFSTPNNRSRRKLWLLKMKRCRWTPNANSRLCANHFTQDQFRTDLRDKQGRLYKAGRKTLKSNAVPTVFHFSKEPVHRKPPMARPPPPSPPHLPNHACLQSAVNIDINGNVGERFLEKVVDEGLVLDQNKVSNACQTDENSDSLRAMRLRITQLEVEAKQLKNALSLVFNEDQIKAMSRKSGRVREWSNGTMKKALQLYFSCGTTGYETLRDQGQPLPSLTTLKEKTSLLNFEPGLLDDVFHLMATKGEKMTAPERECVLMLDEMAIKPKIKFDPAQQSFI
ncbi:hypothetical protein TCAL_15949, partial [Tigriopus californicus]